MSDITENGVNESTSIITHSQQSSSSSPLIPLCRCRHAAELVNDEHPPQRCEAISSVNGIIRECDNECESIVRSRYRAHVRCRFQVCVLILI